MRAYSLALVVLLAGSCSSDTPAQSEPVEDVLQAPDVEEDTAESADVEPTPEPDVFVEPEPELCADGLAVRAFEGGGEGRLRHELAGDFTITRADGIPWTLSEKWTGCDTYIFIPDALPNSQMDPTSIWERDIAELVKRSPPNVHYFFVSLRPPERAAAAAESMLDRVAKELQTLDTATSDEWWFRLHVVQGSAAEQGGWLADVMKGVGQLGFGIDREQRLRGIGSFADVFRINPALQQAEMWPWESNLAYVANEAHYFNALAAREARLATVEATEIAVFSGEILEGFEEIEVELPSAKELAAFDSLELDIEIQCPNKNLPEPGNCGAWDYLAHLSVYDGEERIELGRFITSYHRETRWVLDVSQMMVHLAAGGKRKLRWEFAPDWNKQPSATWLTLRYSNQGKVDRPVEATWLYSGGGFNAMYNEAHPPMEVAIAADATKVELYVTISGHGADTSQCAEFCNHAHEWTINGETFREDHPTVGQQDGCVAELENGMVPNQYGTWWFGRGGWCPGQQVEPWVVDVTHLVDPGGMASISYKGLLGTVEPPDNAGNINMTSWLVTYR